MIRLASILSFRSVALRVVKGAAALLLCVPAFASSSTSTSLAITSGGQPATNVNSYAAVTLTATTTYSGGAVHPGQIKFCDVTNGAPCSFLHLVGTAQLTSTGQASYTFFPAQGTHTYEAIFVAAPGAAAQFAASTSSTSVLNVTGPTPPSVTIAKSGNQGSYTLTATVTGPRPSFPRGPISFQDTSNGNTVVGSATLVASTTVSTFTPASTPPSTGRGPISVAVGDFTGDGIPDVAVANSGDNNVSILRGSTNGTFTVIGTAPAGTVPYAIATGDFNSDGILDLVVVNNLSNTVSILQGVGNGTFTALHTIPVGSSPVSIAVGDYNRDGVQDLAVLNSADDTVSILIGNGQGNFTPTSTANTGANPQAIVQVDFTGDGIFDLAVANFDSNTVSLLVGNGSGHFSLYSSSSVGGNPDAIVVGDFNGDGYSDLAIANSGSNSVTILSGSQNGSLSQLTTLNVGSYPSSVTVSDFNGDGAADLIVTNRSDNTLLYMKGSGTGSFTSVATLSTGSGSGPVSVAAGDFNGDGIPDMVTANLGNNKASIVLTGGTASAIASQTGINPAGIGTHYIEAFFSGDANFGPGNSGIIGLLATNTMTAVNMPSPNTTTVGQMARLTAAVVDYVNYNQIPDGMVTFSNTVNGGTHTAGTAPVVNGVATLNYSVQYGGSNNVTAAFTPNNANNYSPSADTVGQGLSVAPGTSNSAGPLNSTQINSGLNVAKSAQLSITLILTYPGQVPPTGAVSFTVDSLTTGLSGQSCVFKAGTQSVPAHQNCNIIYTAPPVAGTHTLAYNQAGDSNYNSAGGATTITVH